MQVAEIADDDIKQLTTTVWDSILQLPVEEQSPSDDDDASLMSGCVQITGAWTGAVTITCTPALAHRAAGIMFGLEHDAVTKAELLDALGELANMVGGNVKALLPQPCQLSLPTVVEGDQFSIRIPRSELVATVSLACEGNPFTVTLRREEGK